MPNVMATDDSFAELAALIASSKRAKFGCGTPIEVIADAERHLETGFPPSYRWWLANYGVGYLGGHELQGLFPEPIAERDPELPLIGDIVDRARQNAVVPLYPSHLLELLSYDGDEVYFFDTSRRSDSGEWPVVCIHAGSSEPKPTANSFAVFLQRHL